MATTTKICSKLAFRRLAINRTFSRYNDNLQTSIHLTLVYILLQNNLKKPAHGNYYEDNFTTCLLIGENHLCFKFKVGMIGMEYRTFVYSNLKSSVVKSCGAFILKTVSHGVY